MSGFTQLASLKGRQAALPPLHGAMNVATIDPSSIPLDRADAEPQPISAFLCIIDYHGESRLITCRRYDLIGETGYVGAICHSAGGYRQFRCDRIVSVSDANTGEVIGDGSLFGRFAVDSERERIPSWGLTSSRRSILIAGLNILAFMARCDGRWHPLEGEVIESFVCAMWLRKEWDGEPPLPDILAHAQRLAPDADIFFRALRQYAHSETSTRIVRQAIASLIAADGAICSAETQWGLEIDSFFNGYREEEFQRCFIENRI